MSFPKITIEDRLGKEYTSHKVHGELQKYANFYDSLSFSIMTWMPQGVKAFLNLDTYALSSIKETVDSIGDLLQKGRINDAYALIRKYYDSTFINIFSNLYLQDHFSIQNFIVEQIDNWRKGKETIPEFRIISNYIRESDKVRNITELLHKDDRYKKIRNRCNDHTHYNSFHNMVLNNPLIHNPHRIKYLETISFDMESLFIQHFAYLFYLNNHYFMSNYYMDYLDVGMAPEEESQYWVAPFIQEIFKKTISGKRPDIAKEIRDRSEMKLE